MKTDCPCAGFPRARGSLYAGPGKRSGQGDPGDEETAQEQASGHGHPRTLILWGRAGAGSPRGSRRVGWVCS